MNEIRDFVDIFDYYEVPLLQQTWFVVMISCGAVALLIGLVLLWRKYRKRKLKPWQKALKQLQALPLHDAASKNDFKKIYFDMTYILKHYLKERYGWSIDDKTDEELLAFLKQQSFDENIVTQVAQVFEGASWIKYANQHALKTQVQLDRDVIMLVIEKTIPVES